MSVPVRPAAWWGQREYRSAASPAKEEVKVALATFATACGRGSQVPDVASALIGRAPRPAGLEDAITALCGSLVEAADGSVADVLEVIGASWGRLFTTGKRHWRRAFANLAALSDDLLGRPATAEIVSTLIARCAAGRTSGLVPDPDETYTHIIQLMNFHQTKGREVDGVVLVFRPDDFYARREEGEPFVERQPATRARRQGET